MKENIPEQVKHAVDMITVPTGVLASLGVIVDTVINPILAMFVLITSLIWGIYRIKELRNKRVSK